MSGGEPLRRFLTEFKREEREEILRFYQRLVRGKLEELRLRVGDRLIVAEPESRTRLSNVPFRRNPNLRLLWSSSSGPFTAKLYWHQGKGTGYLALYGGAHGIYLPFRSRLQVCELVEALKRLAKLLPRG